VLREAEDCTSQERSAHGLNDIDANADLDAKPAIIAAEEKKNPRDLGLVADRSLRPPSAPRARVLRATPGSCLGFLGVDPFVGLWGLPSYPDRTAS